MYIRKRINALIIGIVMLVVCMAIPISFAIKGSALTEYENYLQSQGFPSSYWPSLEALHDKYPQWIFQAQKVGLNWEDAVNAESSVGRNLVPESSLNSWKSCEYGAFDFDKMDYVRYDNGHWVSASKEIVAYYMDPRNFVNDDSIFMFLNQSYDSATQTIDGIRQMVKGSFLDSSFPEDGYSTYSDVILEAAKQSGVSPYVLASSILQEQGWKGGGTLIQGTYDDYPQYNGYYNYYNINATGSNIVKNGLDYAKTVGWDSRAKSIIGGAIFYGQSYIKVGQNNCYYKKFNVVNNVKYNYYSHQYMTNVIGAASESSRVRDAYTGFTNVNYVFNIPVFNNMPDSASLKPTSNGTTNNWLSSLSVDGNTLTPTFNMFTDSYDLIVDENTYSIHINAKSSDVNAWMKVSGQTAYPTQGSWDVALNDGDNKITMVVEAPCDGSPIEVRRYYTLDVFKKPGTVQPITTTTTETTTEPTMTTTEAVTTTTTTEPTTVPTTAPTAPPQPAVSSSSYTIDKNIMSNVQPDSSVNSFLSNVTISNASAQVVDASENAKSGDMTMATGDKVQIIQNGSVYETYDISVNGDVNGDGKLTSYDLMQINKHILNFSKLSGVYLDAADYDKDGQVSSHDLLMIKIYILKLK